MVARKNAPRIKPLDRTGSHHWNGRWAVNRGLTIWNRRRGREPWIEIELWHPDGPIIQKEYPRTTAGMRAFNADLLSWSVPIQFHRAEVIPSIDTTLSEEDLRVVCKFPDCRSPSKDAPWHEIEAKDADKPTTWTEEYHPFLETPRSDIPADEEWDEGEAPVGGQAAGA